MNSKEIKKSSMGEICNHIVILIINIYLIHVFVAYNQIEAGQLTEEIITLS